MEISQDLQPPITQENIVTQSEKKKTPSITLLGIGALLTAVIAGGIGYYFGSKTSISGVTQPEQMACTMEAKICPDGSSVGRSGPNCEFAKCPDSAIDSSNSITLPNGWVRRGSEITSSEGCYKVQITDIGPLDDMGYYVAESYPGITTFAQSNYFANTYKTLVVPSQGIGEGEKIYIDVNGNIYEISVNYTGKGEGTAPNPEENRVCEQRENELEQVINSITFPKDLSASEASSLLNLKMSGPVVSQNAQEAIKKAVSQHLQKLNITPQKLANEQRDISFEVYKASPEWFFGIGVVTGAKNCDIPSGASECGGPGPLFLILGQKVNGVWLTGVEYTDEFKQLVKAAPTTIMPNEQKRVYVDSY